MFSWEIRSIPIKVHPDAKLILYNSAFWGSPVIGAIINNGIVSFQQANFHVPVRRV